jgi:hypothetical protein
MKIGRIYATSDGESHFGELDIRLTQDEGRPLFSNSARFPGTTVALQHVRAGGTTEWHNPAQRWLALVLAGTHPRHGFSPACGGSAHQASLFRGHS